MGLAYFLYTLVLYPIRLLLELVYGGSYRLISSEGLSIVAVSLIVNLLMLPIYDKADSIRDRVIAKQKKMAGAVSHIKKSFSGDERFLMLSEYYAQNHYSPLSTLLPSLSILLQVPFFMAAYSYLSTLEGLNGRSFLFIKDLACSDSLIVLPHFTLNVLPIAMTLINCVSGAVYTRGQDFSKKLQVYLLASVFLLLLYNSPSGLVLYWTCNNIFSLAKNLFHKPQSDSNSTKTMKAAPLQALIKDKGLCHRAFALSCLLLFLLTGLAIPSALISSSATEFASLGSHPNPLYYVFNCCLQSAGFTLLWPICIYLMFGSGVQAWLALTAGVLALSASTNSYAFMPAYGDISSSLNFLNSVAFKSLSLPSLVNILVLLIITASICLLIQYKNGKPYILVLSVLCLAVSFLSLVNIKTISKDYQAYRSSAEKSRVSDIKPLFHLSRNHPNVLLIMLDRAQPQYVAEIFREDPSLEKSFDGFTFYKNTVSFNGHTIQGAPPLYGGYEYTPLEMNRRDDISLAKKNNESQLLLPRIFTETLGYTAVVTDPEWGNYNSFCDTSFINEYAPRIKGIQTNGVYTDFWFKEKNTGGITDRTGELLERNLLLFSLFRISPVALRSLIYDGGDYWYKDAAAKETNTLIDSYSALDYLKELTDIGETEGGFYLSLTNQLTHTSFYLQAPGYIPVNKVTDYGSSSFIYDVAYYSQMATFKLLAKWFDYLKQEGIWDNTKIVLVSDHGCYWNDIDIEKDDNLDSLVAGEEYNGRGHYHPLLLFKDLGSSGKPVTDAESFMTNADVPSLLLKGLVEQPVNPFTGREISLDTRELKKDGVVISVSDRHKPSDNGKYRFTIAKDQWWRVRNNIYQAASWSQEDLEQ